MNHEVFKDLVPNYLEHLTSDETRRLMEAHMESCPECREYLEDMKEEGMEHQVEQRTAERKQIDYLKAVRSNHKKRMILVIGSMLGVFVFVSVAYYILFVHMWMADQENVDTSIQKNQSTVTMTFQSKKDSRYLIAAKNELKESYTDEIVLYENWNLIPSPSWGPYGEISDMYKEGDSVTYTFADMDTLILDDGRKIKLTDDDKVTVRYDDRTKEIRLMDLYEGKKD
ncbi:zf-HC2 domain-containing protein [Rossellomorea marisflavi]|uniref:anti-sigma factor family protein n=1 Tax=Rossellomorea marisflavi TaxID=189381 RepID=UPI00279EA291|nr:zf-HC2 domain-containing protein [Rossellomorea marisflavi]UTE72290.1 zf-HC2 domain-containing protein [Rossellomorea marisflavi]